MHKKAKSIIAIVLVVAAIAGFFLIDRLTKRTIFSDMSSTGNTTANIYNGGFFCENGDEIFFSNHLDQGSLYKMNRAHTEYEKVCDDNARYINADENYVYYARNNNLKENGTAGIFVFRSNGIYRIGHNGSGIKMLFMDYAGELMLYRNTVYYQHYNEKNGLNLYKVSIDASDDTEITEDMIDVAGINGDHLYYTDPSDSTLMRMSLDNYSTSSVLDKKVYMPVPTDTGIYFISLLDNYSLCFVRYGSDEISTIAKGIISTYNISSDGRYIYYQQDGGSENGVYCYDTVSKTSSLIASGDYKWFNVVDNNLFFYTFDETGVLCYSPDLGTSFFTPEVE